VTAFELRKGEGSQVALQGDLTLATAATAHAAGAGMIAAAAAGGLRIDCSGITAADSAGLAVLLEWCALAARRGVRLQFDGLPDRLRRLAQISEVEALLAPAA
jgi:phospholipid transport system transporter-binding protein